MLYACESISIERHILNMRLLSAFERELNTLNGSVRKGIDLLAGNALVATSNNSFQNEHKEVEKV